MTNSERVSLRKSEVSQVRGKISLIALERLIRADNGVSQIARELGVAKSSVSKALKRLNLAVAKDVTLRAAPRVVDKKIDAIEQLQKINRDANELLDVLMAWHRGENGALQILESQIRKVRVKDSEEEIREYKMADPRQLALRCMSEIREQLWLQHNVMKNLLDIAEVSRFRVAVLAEIGAASPEVRERIMIRLTEMNAISSSLSLTPTVSGAIDLETRLRKAEALRWGKPRSSPELERLVSEVASPRDNTDG